MDKMLQNKCKRKISLFSFKSFGMKTQVQHVYMIIDNHSLRWIVRILFLLIGQSSLLVRKRVTYGPYDMAHGMDNI